MKKKMLFLFVFLAAATLLLTACKTPEVEVNTVYEIAVKADGETLNCSQTTTYVNTVCDEMTELTFAVYPYAYTQDAEHKAYVGELPRYATVNFSKIEVNGEPVEATPGVYMNLPVQLKRGEKVVVRTDYCLTLPECPLRFGQKDGYTNLSGFYPQVAVYGEDGFRTDVFSTVGDPVLSDVADFFCTFDLPESVVAATPFETTTEVGEEGRKILRFEGKNARDIAVVLSEKFLVQESEWEGIKVSYYSAREDAISSCELAKNALATFSKAFGKYPYTKYTVAETPFEADGMEFSGLAYVAVDCSDRERAIIHETAHQWWYNVVGNDNVNAAYLDEGLTTFSTEYYYLLNGDEQKFDEGIASIKNAYARYERLQKMRGENGSLDMTRPIYEYTEYKYGLLVYDKSALMFDALYRLGGKEKFNASLRTYYTDNYFRRADKQALIAAFNRGMRSDVGGLIEGWLSEGAIVATFAS